MIHIHGYEDLDTRASSCPESVALFTDEELMRYAADIIAVDGFNEIIVGHVLGEMLIRLWLYTGERPQGLEDGISAIKNKCNAETLVSLLTCQKVRDLRYLPVGADYGHLVDKAFILDAVLTSDQEEILRFAKSRISAFVECDGIIPVIIGGDAVPIPFAIIWNRPEGKFFDSDNELILGWISHTKELWKALRKRFCIRLGCAFGSHTQFVNGEPLVSGGSFALPLLFAATRDTNSTCERHPLAVICTGELFLGRLKDIAGREEKQRLARRIGAHLFVAPGIGEPWIIQPGMEVQPAISKISQELGEDFATTQARLNRLNVWAQLPFFQTIEELTSGFVGREYQVEKAVSWIAGKIANAANPALLWIEGELGCGKSAFIAALAQRCMEAEHWQAAWYFFGHTADKRERDFLQSSALQVAAAFGIDPAEVLLKGDPLDQFRYVLSESASARHSRFIFLVDGVNEAESKGVVTLLAQAVKDAADCIWIFSGQPTPETKVIRELPNLEYFKNDAGNDGLGRLLLESMHQLVDVAAPDMPSHLRGEIVRKSRGLPLYTRLLLDKWENSRGLMTEADVPDSFDDHYQTFVEDAARQRVLNEAPWRSLVPYILALLTTAKEGTPMSASSIAYALSKMFPQSTEVQIETALKACIPVLRFVTATSGGDGEIGPALWTIKHDSFREFFVRTSSPMLEFATWAKARWKDICHLWEQTIESGARRYALRFLLDELPDDSASVLPLVTNSRFIEAQARVLGAGFALDTLGLSIALALREGKLPEASQLILNRAALAHKLYAGSPLEAVQRKQNAWALDLVSHIENQHDRTLWHLAIAAWHANGKRPQLAAEVLDEHIPSKALREQLPEGASMCAAALLCVLSDLKTRRFQWGRFLSQLTDESKREAARSLIRLEKTNAAWSMLGSIKDDGEKNAARLDVVRELAATDPKLAERQLARFESNSHRAWAAQEIVAAFAQRRLWMDMWRTLDTIDALKTPRQRAKALCYVAVMLHRNGDKTNSAIRFKESVRMIGACGSLDMQALAWGEFALAHADVEEVSEVENGIKNAFSILEEAEIQEKTGWRPRQFGKFTHLKRAERYVSLTASLSRVASMDRRFLNAMKIAVSRADAALVESAKDGNNLQKVNDTRLRLLRALAVMGHFGHAKVTLSKLQGRESRAGAAARLCVYLLRHGFQPSESLERESKGRDQRMLMAGMKAIELWVSSPTREAISEVCSGLFIPGRQGTVSIWGPPRILGEAASSLGRARDSRASSLFDTALEMLNRLFETYRGWYLAELAFQCARGSHEEKARELLLRARDFPPDTEAEEVRMLAKIEQVELQFNLRTAMELEAVGAFKKVFSLPDKHPLHKIKLMHRLVRAFGEAGRADVLEQLCAYSHERLATERYHLLPEERSECAGDFAADVAKAAHNVHVMKDWAIKFEEICQKLASDAENTLSVPDSAFRARALIQALEDSNRGITLAKSIRGGKERGKALRDLALLAVARGAYLEAERLCRHIEHDRSDHLPDIALAIAEKSERDSDHARAVLNRLLTSCSEYREAAYRAVAALIRFYQPEPEMVMAIATVAKPSTTRRPPRS